MERPVYVLGAGFCRDFNRTVFPLASDFLAIAKSLNRYLPGGLHQKLSMFISDYFGDIISADIEKVLSFLSSSLLDDPRWISGETSVLYNQLVNIICDTLNAASATAHSQVNRLADPSVRNAGRLYSRFISDLVERNAIIVTFNYDLVIEYLLQSTGSWTMADGYAIDIPFIDEAFPVFLRTGEADPGRREVASSCFLLKLHGSINWGSPVVAGQKVTDRKLYRLRDGRMNFSEVEHPDFPFRIAFRPVIVPPVVDKSSWLQNSAIRDLWNMAMEAVRRANEITFIGYSLPPTDFAAEFMFRHGARRCGAKQVAVVCPDANTSPLQSRFTSIFGESVTFIAEPFREWAGHRYFASSRSFATLG